jgi:hypothetical protein
MSPFAVAVILILTILFALLSLVPVISGQSDMDALDNTYMPKTKTAH